MLNKLKFKKIKNFADLTAGRPKVIFYLNLFCVLTTVLLMFAGRFALVPMSIFIVLDYLLDKEKMDQKTLKIYEIANIIVMFGTFFLIFAKWIF